MRENVGREVSVNQCREREKLLITQKKLSGKGHILSPAAGGVESAKKKKNRPAPRGIRLSRKKRVTEKEKTRGNPDAREK